MAVHAFDKVNQISKAKSKQIASESSVVRPESMPSQFLQADLIEAARAAGDSREANGEVYGERLK
jgi:hypothetical protein